MQEQIKIVDFDLYSPKDISEVFSLVCRRMGLKIRDEESKCFTKDKVDFQVIVNLANRYDLKVTMDFKLHQCSLEYPARIDDVRSLEDIIKEEEEAKKKLSEETLKEISGEKMAKELKDIEINEAEPQNDGELDVDDDWFSEEE